MKIKEVVKIVLPLPPSSLSPNRPPASRAGRFAKAVATKQYRRRAREAVEAEQIETGPWEMVIVDVEFFHAIRRRRDEDNAMGSLKAAYDGIVDSGLVVDDDYLHMSRGAPRFSKDRKSPRVVLTIERRT